MAAIHGSDSLAIALQNLKAENDAMARCDSCVFGSISPMLSAFLPTTTLRFCLPSTWAFLSQGENEPPHGVLSRLIENPSALNVSMLPPTLRASLCRSLDLVSNIYSFQCWTFVLKSKLSVRPPFFYTLEHFFHVKQN